MKKKNETFSMMVILLIPVAIAINIVGGQMTSILKIPVDLDITNRSKRSKPRPKPE